MNLLIILGNGKSLSDIDLNLLNRYSTFGLNNGFINYERLGWFPTYYGCFGLEESKLDFENADRFIHKYHDKFRKMFVYPSNPEHFELNNVEGVNLDLNTVKFNVRLTGNHSNAIEVDIVAAKALLPVEEQEPFDNFIRFLTEEEQQQFSNCNMRGMLHMFRNEKVQSVDKIAKPRFQLKWIMPESLEQFNFLGGNSALIASKIGYVLGYRKIILLGCDTRWEAKDNILQTKNTYWFEDYFKDGYNIKEICPICTPERIQEMHFEAWETFKDTIEALDIDLEIVNCTPNSALKTFRESTLEEELWK